MFIDASQHPLLRIRYLNAEVSIFIDACQ